MIVRYGKNQKGKTVKLAVIYTKEEHGIGREKFDFDAVSICEKIRYAGYKSYIVGGAVRDLLLNNSPKDFDIVTDAVPSAIKKIFRRSRIIGKRFRLVHVYQGKNIYEVATFRSGSSESHNNSFGTMAEDVWRRDFTINSLYFCPFDEQIIDFTGGYKDLAKRLVKPVIPLKTIFLEDPVRIIRAVKYSVMIGGDLPFFLKMRIKKHARELLLCSPSRITEEALKIMKTEYSADIFRRLTALGILKLVLPGVYEMQKNSSFYKRIEIFDNLKKAGKISTESLSAVLQPLIEDFIIGIHAAEPAPAMTMKEIVDDVKIFLRPITPPNRDIADAVKMIVRQNRIKVKPALPYHFRPKH